jgi:AraC family transcriptional regulator, regulatory protein of adaptative response / DNA-3-methyladenine glycosylase II
VINDPDQCYRAIESRDSRFDGRFIVAVTSTRIYCRPSCPARTPKRANVRFYASAAAAHGAGYRACKRCRPDASPGSPDWNRRSDLVARAMRAISDGAVDREGVAGLARRLAYSERHLHRVMIAEVGAGPIALARARRAQTARILIETTDLPFAEVSSAAGFASVRQFNDTIREVFAETPSALRVRTTRRAAGPSGELHLRLSVRRPFAVAPLLAFLAARQVGGVEAVVGDRLTRVMRLPHGPGVATAHLLCDRVDLALRLDDLRDLTAAVQRMRDLLDLDADPIAVDAALGCDPMLAASVAAHPGLRVPGAVDGFELAVRAVLGQQVSVASATASATRLVAQFGVPLGDCGWAVFPSAKRLAEVDPRLIALPATRARTVVALAREVAEGNLTLDSGVDRDDARARLVAIPGIGPWTAEYVAMRALRDPDAFPASDLVLRRQIARRLGSDSPHLIADHAARWAPWRAYAALHLWTSAAADRSTT